MAPGRGKSRASTPGSPRSKSAPPREAPPEDVKGGQDEEASATDMLELGMGVVGAMTEEDMATFLDRLLTECPLTDKLVPAVRFNEVKWGAVAFGAYGAEECQAAWLYLKTGTRKFRIMAELVQEVKITLQSPGADKAAYQRKMLESAPGFPKKPPGMGSAFHMFCFEMWSMKPADSGEKNFIVFQTECQELFKSLSKEQQEKFQLKSDLAKAEYVRQVKEFSLRHPGLTTQTTMNKDGKMRTVNPKKIPLPKLKYTRPPAPPLTPHLLFIQTKLNKLEVAPTREELPGLKAKFKEKWQKFSERKKAKWIGKCIKKSQNYVIEMEEYKKRFPEYVAKDFRIEKRVSKNELEIWEKFRGKPIRPPLTAFDLFFAEFSKNSEYSEKPTDELKTLAREKWTKLDYFHKEMYKVNLRKMTLEYTRDLEKYYETIPDLIKPVLFENLPKKYQNALSVVDKTLDFDRHDSQDEDTSMWGEQTEIDTYAEESEDRQSPKKKKKRKHTSPDEGEGTEQEQVEDDEVVCLDDPDTNAPSTSKKKKRKRQRSQGDEDETDERAEDPGHNGEWGGGDEVPFYDRELNDDERNEIEAEKKWIEQFPTRNKLEKRHKIGVKKPKVQEFGPSKGFKMHHAFDVIRGIFDARQNLGRSYSVFYYYAKYVAKEPLWVEKSTSIGLMETAEQICFTFLNLSNHQKQIFIDQSFTFHRNKVKEERYENADFCGREWEKYGFPGEPKPPPRTAQKLYISEVKKLKMSNKNLNFPIWSELDEEKQTLYLKKLYRVTNLYLKEYEEFVAKMSPSDLIAYTVDCSNIWEKRYMTLRANKLAAKGFTFPFPKRELSGQERDPSPEIIESDVLRKRMERQSKNLPEEETLLGNDDFISAMAQRIQPGDMDNLSDDDKGDTNESDGDSPSDEELLSTDPRHAQRNERIRLLNEIKNASICEYPIQFL